MSDWEDDDFEVEISAENAGGVFEEVDKALEVSPVEATKPSAAQLAAQKKKEQEDAAALSAKVKAMELAGESTEDRKLREKAEIEDAEAALAGDMFGAAVAPAPKATSETAVDAISKFQLKNKKDFESFALAVSGKMSGATSMQVCAFLAKFLELQGETMSVEGLNDITNKIKLLKDNKKLAADVSKRQAAASKNAKKAKKAKVQRHNDIYGGDFHHDEDDRGYGDLEDDFM